MSSDEVSMLDRQIEQLFDYKPIPEFEVKALCDKVSGPNHNSIQAREILSQESNV